MTLRSLIGAVIDYYNSDPTDSGPSLDGLTCGVIATPASAGYGADVLAEGLRCDGAAIRSVQFTCGCGHVLTGLECREHARNTGRIFYGLEGSPNICADCNQAGHCCPVIPDWT